MRKEIRYIFVELSQRHHTDTTAKRRQAVNVPFAYSIQSGLYCQDKNDPQDLSLQTTNVSAWQQHNTHTSVLKQQNTLRRRYWKRETVYSHCSLTTPANSTNGHTNRKMTNFPASSSRSFSSPPICSALVASTNPTKIIALQLGR